MVQRLEEAYRLLGVPADSDPERVAEAYRRLARATHPDVSADPDAAARFVALASAYRLVSAAARSAQSTGRPQEGGTSRSGRAPADPPPATSRAGAASGSMGAPPLGEVSPYPRAGHGRPPIVAGPVSVRRLRDET